MPVPTPRKGEEKDKFISRCISMLSKEDPDRSKDQITAICYDKWRSRNTDSSSEVWFSTTAGG